MIPPQALDKLALGAALWMAGAISSHYLPSPWLWIPAALSLGWAAGWNLGAAYTIVRRAQRERRRWH